ncbi:hypothetical protein PIB30_038501 [Stylosanthes scabra]|uniref:Uncharacterized protein n=1 Tax=Stylosanthes scabra TaxID=79078 RepID=A0ABU6SEC3_9FABA|nr:hypothetical protein [Stylosanthes scabra]
MTHSLPHFDEAVSLSLLFQSLHRAPTTFSPHFLPSRSFVRSSVATIVLVDRDLNTYDRIVEWERRVNLCGAIEILSFLAYCMSLDNGRVDLLWKGFMPNYETWVQHREENLEDLPRYRLGGYNASNEDLAMNSWSDNVVRCESLLADVFP